MTRVQWVTPEPQEPLDQQVTPEPQEPLDRRVTPEPQEQRAQQVTPDQQVPHPQSLVQRVLTLRSPDPLGLRDRQERVAVVAVQSRSLAQQDSEVS